MKLPWEAYGYGSGLKNNDIDYFKCYDEPKVRINNIEFTVTAGSSYIIPGIKRVIFNAPATIVIWDDNTKTVVKSGDYDVYDPEKGLAMAISKKALGNRGKYYEVFKKHLPEEEGCDTSVLDDAINCLKEALEPIRNIKLECDITTKK